MSTSTQNIQHSLGIPSDGSGQALERKGSIISTGGREGSKYSLTVTKIDAGMAILLTSNNQLIEFPSYLLPPGVQPGSVINLQLSRNISQEEQQRQALREVQEHILKEFGTSLPKPPVLRVLM
ncbi:hypothetical protein H4219_005452 [Mycoemilia scoparia]|uniref:Chitin biosynthesis protein Chs5 N-terminal domain-containing protein n=1 Tax=Mycoemilia scoparia TaxID=417184 RepID=A0A9W7ZUJ5_9FUNG|nr:hypothetical protein H4219_005452 [Mycoemilia scoparia]